MDNDNVITEVNTAPAGAAPTPKPRGIAPAWHTLVLLVLFIGLSAAGSHGQEKYVTGHGRMPLYLFTMGFEWIATVYVVWGAHLRGVTLRELTGGRWAQPEDALLDVAIAIGFWIAAIMVLAVIGLIVARVTGQIGPAIGGTPTAAKLAERCAELKSSVGFLAPANRLEVLVWLATSATAGICEELIFRGYFMRQFTAWSGGIAAVGLLAQAVLFGSLHGYEGPSRMVLIAVYGLLFGGLALWRRSLRPGMITHALHDGVMGLMIRPALRLMGC